MQKDAPPDTATNDESERELSDEQKEQLQRYAIEMAKRTIEEAFRPEICINPGWIAVDQIKLRAAGPLLLRVALRLLGL